MSRGANLHLSQSASSSDPTMVSIEQFVNTFGGTRAIDKVIDFKLKTGIIFTGTTFGVNTVHILIYDNRHHTQCCVNNVVF